MKNYLYILLGIVLATGGMVYAASGTTQQADTYKTNDFVTATTTQATSTPQIVTGAERINLYFTRNGASDSVATSTFSVQVSPDGTNWYAYNKLVSNVTNANSENLTRVSSVNIVGATSTTLVAVDLTTDAFHSIRCIANNASTTLEADDSNTCTYYIEY